MAGYTVVKQLFYSPNLFRTSFILCCRCFRVNKIRELHVQKICENGQGKNPRDTGTSLDAKRALQSKIVFFSFWANKLRFLAKLSPIVKSELKIFIFCSCSVGSDPTPPLPSSCYTVRRTSKREVSYIQQVNFSAVSWGGGVCWSQIINTTAKKAWASPTIFPLWKAYLQ